MGLTTRLATALRLNVPFATLTAFQPHLVLWNLWTQLSGALHQQAKSKAELR
jgi:hypothetical protein